MAVGEASSMERPTTSDKLQSVPFSVATNGTFTVAPQHAVDEDTRAALLGESLVPRPRGAGPDLQEQYVSFT